MVSKKKKKNVTKENDAENPSSKKTTCNRQLLRTLDFFIITIFLLVLLFLTNMSFGCGYLYIIFNQVHFYHV